MSHDSIEQALYEYMDANWNTTDATVIYENGETKNNTTPWLRFGISFFSSVNAVVGGSKQEIRGIVYAQIFTKTKIGSGSAMNIAQTFINLFQNIQLNNVFLYAGNIVKVGEDPEQPNLYHVNAKIPFESI